MILYALMCVCARLMILCVREDLVVWIPCPCPSKVISSLGSLCLFAKSCLHQSCGVCVVRVACVCVNHMCCDHYNQWDIQNTQYRHPSFHDVPSRPQFRLFFYSISLPELTQWPLYLNQHFFGVLFLPLQGSRYGE